MSLSLSAHRLVRFGSLCLLLIGFGSLAWSAESPATAATAPLPALPATKAPAPTVKTYIIPEVDRPFVPTGVIGSLQRLNMGQVNPWDLTTIDITGTIGAFGAGTTGKYAGIGEMLSFAGRTFIRSTDPKTGVNVVEMTQPFKSPFAVLVAAPPDVMQNTPPKVDAPFLLKSMPKAVKDSKTVFPRVYRIFAGVEPQLLHSVLEKLANEVSGPVAVLGWVEMPTVEGIALKKSPIDSESLTGSQKDQYLDTINTNDQHMVFFAVVSPIMPVGTINNALFEQGAFDYNPDQGQPAAALIHVHGALVQEAPPEVFQTTPTLLAALKTVTVKDILHVYGTSLVKEGQLLVFRLKYDKAN